MERRADRVKASSMRLVFVSVGPSARETNRQLTNLSIAINVSNCIDYVDPYLYLLSVISEDYVTPHQQHIAFYFILPLSSSQCIAMS